MIALLALLSPDAHACGGFACDNARPVMQAAERILFAVDLAKEEVEAHVQITYTGESEDFAWIVPVTGEPEIFLSTDALFSTLYFPTNPNYTLTTVELGTCRSDSRGVSLAGSADAAVSSSVDFESGGVNVLATSNVGPYSTTVIEADSSAALMAWLDTEGYDIPANFEPVLAPYVASGQNFIALKLLPGNSSGDIAPLGMRYAGTKPSIPIQLTSIAAVPDTRLEVYVVGASRAVPESYLHVVPNDMAYDYFGQTVVYDDIITRAADEAGGQAFSTDWAGSTSLMRDVLYNDTMFDEDGLATAPDIFAWMDVILGGGFLSQQSGGYYSYYTTFDVNLANVLRTVLPLPASVAADGVTESMFWTNLRYYEASFDAEAIDLSAATAAVDAGFVEPRRHANALFRNHNQMSRLTSSLDAAEMTVDPTFVFNADMDQIVDINHPATLTYHCENGEYREHAYRDIAFPDGTTVDLPSEDWFNDEGITEYEYLSDLAALSSAVIEKTGATGEPETWTDNRETLAGIADGLNADFAEMFLNGCGGCNGGPVSASPLLIGLAAIVARRRRV